MKFEIRDSKSEIGPLAEVFHAREVTSGRGVALKRFLSHHNSDPRFAIRFREELKRLAPVQHRALVTILDYGFDGDSFYIASEWVEGVNLHTYLAEYGALSPTAAVYVAREICAALGVLHRAGLIHRGLKPENVFITTDGSVKVADATFSQLASESGLSRTHVMLGSVAYMSPEQARGRPTGPQSDIYSLGVMLFEMLTDRLPFESSDSWSVVRMHVQETPPSPREHNPDVPQALADVVVRALQKEPSDRYTTIEALDAALAPLPQSDELLWLIAPQHVLNGGRRQLAARLEPAREKLVTVWQQAQDVVREKVRPRAETALLRLRDAVETRAQSVLKGRRLSFGQLLAVNFLVTFVLAFVAIYLLSGVVASAQDSGTTDAPATQSALNAGIRKGLPVATPTLMPTIFVEQEPEETATPAPTAIPPAAGPAPTATPVEAVQGNGGPPPGAGGPPPHAGGNGPPPHAGPPGGPPGQSGNKPGGGKP